MPDHILCCSVVKPRIMFWRKKKQGVIAFNTSRAQNYDKISWKLTRTHISQITVGFYQFLSRVWGMKCVRPVWASVVRLRPKFMPIIFLFPKQAPSNSYQTFPTKHKIHTNIVQNGISIEKPWIIKVEKLNSKNKSAHYIFSMPLE